MDAQAARPTRTLIIILALVAVLVVAALAVVFTRGQPKLFDAATPEGVVQRYAAAVIDGDEAAAAAYLSTQARSGCGPFERPFQEDVRVTLVSTQVRPESADVKVSIAWSAAGGPFEAPEYQTEAVFDLVREGGAWRISGVPWELSICPGKAVAP